MALALKSTAFLGSDAYPRRSPFRLPPVRSRVSFGPVRFGETTRADSVDEKDGGADVPKSLQKHFNFFPRPLSVADFSGEPKDGKQLRISFKGLKGSYSEEAALKAYPKCETVPCEEFEDAFKAVELWIVDKAILPIESSSGGSIHRNYDLLLRHRLHIVGEVQLPINFCLLALPGVRAEQLKRVISHPQVTPFNSFLTQRNRELIVLDSVSFLFGKHKDKVSSFGYIKWVLLPFAVLDLFGELFIVALACLLHKLLIVARFSCLSWASPEKTLMIQLQPLSI